MAPIYYLADEITQFFYNEINKEGSHENAVDSFWVILLGNYFPREQKFSIDQERRDLPAVTRKRANWTIRYIKNGSPKKMALMEDNRKGYETQSSAWRDAQAELTRYLCLIRTEAGQNPDEVLYGAVNIGTCTRFYELQPQRQECIDYVSDTSYSGQALQVWEDEAMVHRILLELGEKTKQ